MICSRYLSKCLKKYSVIDYDIQANPIVDCYWLICVRMSHFTWSFTTASVCVFSLKQLKCQQFKRWPFLFDPLMRSALCCIYSLNKFYRQ